MHEIIVAAYLSCLYTHAEANSTGDSNLLQATIEDETQGVDMIAAPIREPTKNSTANVLHMLSMDQ